MSVDFLPNRATPTQLEAARVHLERRARLYNTPAPRAVPIVIPPPVVDPLPAEPVEEVGASPEVSQPLTVWSVMRAACKKYRLTLPELRGRSRRSDIVLARQECFYIMRHDVLWLGRKMSLPEIGHLFGRDHTTILDGIRRHTKRLEEAK